MLTITERQFAAFSRAASDHVHEALVTYALGRFPQLEEVPAVVSRLQEAAARLGVGRTENLATLFDLATMYGEQILEAPWLRDALNRPGCQPDDVVPALEAALKRAGVQL